jgi:uncharacterized membrane protein
VRILLSMVALVGLLADPGALAAAAAPASPVVRAVLFWSEECPACHIVVQEVLPPLEQQYGNRLVIQRLEMSDPVSVDLYEAAARMLDLAPEDMVVPLMVAGAEKLVGWREIRDRLPVLVRGHLAKGGLGWPAIPGLDRVVGAQAPPSTRSDAAAPSPPPFSPAASLPQQGIRQTDPIGFTLALLIMAAMVASLVYAGIAVLGGRRRPRQNAGARMSWLIPSLAVAGLAVAGYLSYVETQMVAAVCGPVGDCNAVQSSPYARLFGVIPVAIAGAAGYVGILAAWLWERRCNPGSLATLVTFGIALCGVVFSLYLTYLEPFVIQAVCAWCLTSSVVITLIMLVSAGPARRALALGKASTGDHP